MDFTVDRKRNANRINVLLLKDSDSVTTRQEAACEDCAKCSTDAVVRGQPNSEKSESLRL